MRVGRQNHSDGRLRYFIDEAKLKGEERYERSF
jgi:hypothetical protein